MFNKIKSELYFWKELNILGKILLIFSIITRIKIKTRDIYFKKKEV